MMMAAAGLAACAGINDPSEAGLAGAASPPRSARRLRADRRPLVVTWDQRGSGLSRRHDCGAYTMDQLDADLDALYFYSDAKDGWYSGTGGTLHAGAKGGVTNDLDLPFYATLGANVRF
jgi:hypothetical protein